MKILILTNYDFGLYRFRRELLERIVQEHEVAVSVPNGEFVRDIQKIGCQVLTCDFLERRGMNPVKELKLMFHYRKILKQIKPDIVFTYTIKPNVYGGMACASLGIPYVANITGLGTSVENGGLVQEMTLLLYRYGLRKAQTVFFQNQNNYRFMREKGVIGDNCKMIPGSGVNLQDHCFEPYPSEEAGIRFLFVGRIMKDKGIEEYLECAKQIHAVRSDCSFGILGFFDEEDYREPIERCASEGIVTFFGKQTDVHSFMKSHHVLIQPSYHEGLSNVLLEAAACGRPVLASNIPGCRETFVEGVSGFGFEPKNSESLIRTVEKMLALTTAEREKMGKCGRQKVEREFSRQLVIDAYIKELQSVQ